MKENAFIQLELERLQALKDGQPWTKEWVRKVVRPDNEAMLALLQMPRHMHGLMIQYPPGCLVMTRPETNLVCPAPGTVGIVVSFFEAGTLGVVQKPGGLVRAQCHPIWLEVIAYRPPCDPLWMKGILQWNEE